MSDIKPTSEQAQIVDLTFKPGEIIKANAFAGTGKTSTLIMFAKANPGVRMLYVAFSKAVQMEAEKKFKGTSVEARTSHSLAWGRFGGKFKDAGKLAPNLKAKDIAEALGSNRYDIVRFVMQTVNNFIASADREIAGKHVPPEVRGRFKGPQDPADDPREPMPDFVSEGKKLWNMMCDLKNSRVGMVHDGYLKLFQLSNPVLNYDVILLDEAQDINPSTAAIVLSQRATRILVGDKHQQIFSFRGADNILAKIKADQEFYITKSFRFGRKVGILATLILKHFKGEKRQVSGLNGEGSMAPVDTTKPYTIISRTNAILFTNAVTFYKTKKLHFVSGVDKYGFDVILDTYYLWAGQKHMIKDRYIAGFSSFGEMKEFATQVEDIEILVRANVVEQYGNEIPTLLMEIQRAHVQDQKDADITLTTAHRSKGLEFNQVKLSDDFQPLVKVNDKTGEEYIIGRKALSADEFNLMYVAATRAISVLEVNSQLHAFLRMLGALYLMDDSDEEAPAIPVEDQELPPDDDEVEIEVDPKTLFNLEKLAEPAPRLTPGPVTLGSKPKPKGVEINRVAPTPEPTSEPVKLDTPAVLSGTGIHAARSTDGPRPRRPVEMEDIPF